MTELSEDNITLLIGGGLGGLFISIISYILRKYVKNSKCHNAILGDLELNSAVLGDLKPKSEENKIINETV
jgi:hypothetical protein